AVAGVKEVDTRTQQWIAKFRATATRICAAWLRLPTAVQLAKGVSMLKKTSLALCLSATILAMPAFADEEREAIPLLDHVFLIVMENHSAAEVLGNTARAPFINQYA